MDKQPKRVLTARTVRYCLGDISEVSLWRWVQQGIVPPPIKINGRNYWREADIVAVQEGAAAKKAVTP
jgi:predicted DNA-binding transcriptional regulator AlpA